MSDYHPDVVSNPGPSSPRFKVLTVLGVTAVTVAVAWGASHGAEDASTPTVIGTYTPSPDAQVLDALYVAGYDADTAGTLLEQCAR